MNAMMRMGIAMTATSATDIESPARPAAWAGAENV